MGNSNKNQVIIDETGNTYSSVPPLGYKTLWTGHGDTPKKSILKTLSMLQQKHTK